MIRRLAIAGALALAWAPAAVAGEGPQKIRINTVGYTPTAPKVASIAAPCKAFRVVPVSGGPAAIEGVATGPRVNPDTGEALYSADFSTLTTPGDYRLDVPGVGRSDPFRVAGDVYAPAFRLAARGMYLWRCGTAVRGDHGGSRFEHGPCHLADGWLDAVGGGHARKDGTGGWHDAGDYNKYTINAGVTVAMMLRAWGDFGPEIARVPLDIPAPAGPAMPGFLAEVRWEVDWLLKMQNPDGSVSHKLTTRNFGGFVPPETEATDRLFTPWGSAATANFAATTAMTARHLLAFDPPFAARCLAAARKASAFLASHPEDHQADQAGFNTGGYGTTDPDDRLWAAAELWEATGERAFLVDLEARIRAADAKVDGDWDWAEVRDLGLLTYLDSARPGRDAATVDRVRKNVVAAAGWLATNREAHGYGRPIGSSYYWGCNGSVARSAILLHAADSIAPNPAYRAAILDGLNHLLGRNVDARSYVTGLGARPPMHPHDRRSGGDAVDDPWPGYLVGGPHPKAASWKDEQGDYFTNEIAINWNGALIYALAAALGRR